jgi:hypothetical protein
VRVLTYSLSTQLCSIRIYAASPSYFAVRLLVLINSGPSVSKTGDLMPRDQRCSDGGPLLASQRTFEGWRSSTSIVLVINQGSTTYYSVHAIQFSLRRADCCYGEGLRDPPPELKQARLDASNRGLFGRSPVSPTHAKRQMVSKAWHRQGEKSKELFSIS